MPFGIVSLKQKCFDAGIDIEIEEITKEIPLVLTRGGQKNWGRSQVPGIWNSLMSFMRCKKKDNGSLPLVGERCKSCPMPRAELLKIREIKDENCHCNG